MTGQAKLPKNPIDKLGNKNIFSSRKGMYHAELDSASIMTVQRFCMLRHVLIHFSYLIGRRRNEGLF